jgi:putative nucleotidyltransferase with HDIG domain
MASDPEVPGFKLAELVGKDPVLASRLLGLANSAFSASSRPISTVLEAITRVGTAAVRNVIVTVSLTSMKDRAIYGTGGQALFDHALGTAYTAHLIAERVRVSQDEAFLAGLMHDIGKLVILRLAYDHGRRTGEKVAADDLKQALRERHAMMGSLALRRWHLPESVDDPVMFHHNYEAAPRRQREVEVCYLANRLSHRYGFGCEPEPVDSAEFVHDDVFARLGLDQGWLDATDARAPGIVSAAIKSLG